MVLDVNTALDLFPSCPEDHALALRVGQTYPRKDLEERLERLGYEHADVLTLGKRLIEDEEY